MRKIKMIRISDIGNFPSNVSKVLDEVKQEETSESIWLVGSRANQTATQDSDWDFLVFTNIDELIAVTERSAGIDIIRVSSTGQVLVEGKSDTFKHDFKMWEWRQISNNEAEYIGNDFFDYPQGVRDAEEPVFKKTQQPAFLVWERK